MRILGIETSCDETAAAVVKNGEEVLSNIVLSSLKEHQKFGGIIPEIASRRQIELINTVVKSALKEANTTLDQMSAIAVTKEPGLIGSLLVGTSFARALAFATQKPLIEADHIKAHIYANFLYDPQTKNIFKRPDLPAIGLVVSGGHTNLYEISSFQSYELLGHTLDDAAGEAFDKVARLLNLGYPGGPIIDRLAAKGINSQIRFPAAKLPGTYNFSFSGTKTAVLNYTKKHKQLDEAHINRTAYAFQDSVVSILREKCISACKKRDITTLLIGGGVAANSALRESLTKEAGQAGIRVYFPPMAYCLDNGAMIAGYAFHRLKK